MPRGEKTVPAMRTARWRFRLCTSLASRPMTVVFGLGTRLRVRMRTKLDFHRAQAIERWVNKGTNGVYPTDKALVTDALRRLAYATTGKIMEHI